MEKSEFGQFYGDSDDFEEEDSLMDREPISLEGASKKLESIQTEYKKFETPENEKRIKALKEIFDELEREGKGIAVFFGGSLPAGQSVEESDIEIQLLSDGSSDLAETEKLLSEKIHEKLGKEIRIDFWRRPIDLSKVDESLQELETTGEARDISGILDLYFSYHLSSLRMGKNCKQLINKIHSLRYRSMLLDNTLKDLGTNRLGDMRPFFKNSFRKYRERLENNPKFTILSKEEQKATIEKISDLEHNFLTY